MGGTGFLDAPFDKENELRLFLSGPLSDASVDILLKRLEAVACEFQDLLKRCKGSESIHVILHGEIPKSRWIDSDP